MKIAIEGTKYVFTTDSPASHYGLPVLLDTTTGDVYGPSQLVSIHPKMQKMVPAYRPTAAEVIRNIIEEGIVSYRYAFDSGEEMERCYTPYGSDVVATAKLYLGQWPEGPQLD